MTTNQGGDFVSTMLIKQKLTAVDPSMWFVHLSRIKKLRSQLVPNEHFLYHLKPVHIETNEVIQVNVQQNDKIHIENICNIKQLYIKEKHTQKYNSYRL